MPAYAHLVDEAVGWGIRSHTTHADRIAAATRRLAVLFGREATGSWRDAYRPKWTRTCPSKPMQASPRHAPSSNVELLA